MAQTLTKSVAKSKHLTNTDTTIYCKRRDASTIRVVDANEHYSKANSTPRCSFNKAMERIKLVEKELADPKGLLPETELHGLLEEATAVLREEKNIVSVNFGQSEDMDGQAPVISRITVVGDTHGQFFDFCRIFHLNGYPSASHCYVFNGDFVDRGKKSVEIMTLLLLLKVEFPKTVFLVRGNHESRAMNMRYGFTGEVLNKYGQTTLEKFWQLFDCLPMGVCLQERVFVVHGGLPRDTSVTVDDIQAMHRFDEPSPDNRTLFDLLWADPQHIDGVGFNASRGGGTVFGPDVTRQFLRANQLELLVRSHQVKDKGFEVQHGGKLVTVFSAPNYCGFTGNLGAVINFESKDCKPHFRQFTESKRATL